MDLAAISVLSLLGGYCFACVWRGTAFATRKLDGHHLYFSAALYGVIFFLSALTIRATLLSSWLAYQRFDSTLVDYIRPVLKDEPGSTARYGTRRAEWVIASIYSLILGATCGPALNRVTPRRWVLQRNPSPFYGLLSNAHQNEQLLALTISTGEIYVGRVVMPEPADEPVIVTLLAVFSGYRNSECRMQLTTDYEVIYRSLHGNAAIPLRLSADWSEPFEITIRAEDIVAAAPFSPDVYEKLNPGWRQRLARQALEVARDEALTSDDPPNPPVYVLSQAGLSSIGTNFRFSGPT